MKHAVRILVVNSDVAIRETTRQIVDTTGHEILEAQDGVEALQKVRVYQPDVVLLDVNLPKMDELVTCRQIKTDPNLAAVYVLLLFSEDVDSNNLPYELDTGADGYIIRPIPNRELLARVQALLRIKTAEQALLLSEERFHTVYDHLPVGYHSLDTDGRLLDVNQVWLNILGYAREEVIGKWFGDFLVSEQRELFKEHFQVFKQAGETHNAEFELLHKDGSHLYISFDGRISYDEDMQFKQTYCILTNVTARRQAEEALREREAFIQAVLDNLPIGIAVNSVEPAVNFVYMNDNFPKFYRTTREKLADPDAFWNAVYEEPGFREEIKKKVLDGVDSGDAESMHWADIPITRKGEGTFFVNARNIPLPDASLMISTVWDVTERKQAEEEKAQLWHVLDKSLNEIYIFDTQTFQFQHVNEGAKQNLGYSSAELLAMTPLDIKPTFTKASFEELVKPLLHRQKEMSVFETIHRRADGSLYPVEVHLQLVEQGNRSQFLAIINDITERKQTEEQLRLRSTALEVAANAIFITDCHGAIEWINPAFSALTGYSSEEVIGQNLRKLKSDLQDRDFYENLWKTILAGKVWHNELVNKRKDGSLYTEEETITPLKDENGKIVYFIGIKQDVTKRKQSEAAIKRHLSDLEVLYDNGLKLARLLERQMIAQCIIDLLAERLNWHHAVLRLLNGEKDTMEILGFNYSGLAPVQVEKEQQRLKTIPFHPGTGLAGWALEQGQVVRCGDLSTDGRYLETYTGMQSGLYVPIQGAERTIGVISIESEQLDAFTMADERLLVTLAAQAAAAFENARLYSETIHHLDELNTLAQVSAAMLTASGRAEILQAILERTAFVSQAQGTAFASRDPLTGEIVFELGAGVFLDYTNLRLPSDRGILAWVLETGELYLSQDAVADLGLQTPIPLLAPPQFVAFVPLTSQNQTIGVLLVGNQNSLETNQVNLLRSIANMGANALQRVALYEQTLRYASELEQHVEERTAELRITNAALERASQSKDEFLASMSHELRTPLTAVLNFSEILQEQLYGTLNEKQSYYVRTIEESGRHLLGLINDILDISKIDAGQLELQFETCQVEMVCQSILQLSKGLAEKKNQQVSLSIFPRKIELEADPRRLKQMLLNLLSNAVKFTPPGGKIGLDVIADEWARVVHFAVWDTGIGIAQEDFSRLFQPFSQLDASLSRQYEGTGLGLSITQRFADKHGGSLSLESTLGQGSRFTIHLPWRIFLPTPETAIAETQLPTETQPPEASLPVPFAKPNSKPFRLLLADDNQLNREIYAGYLEDNGYQVLLAHSGQEVLDIAREQHPDLILIDIQMPGMDGLAAIRQLRTVDDTELARTPMIALTALVMPGDREHCLQAGANEYLRKPVGLRDLLRTVQKYLKA